MIVPIIKEKKENNSKTTIALDPGVRTFQVGFKTDGSFVEYGSKSVSKLYSLGLKMDELKSKIDKHQKDRYNSKKERIQYKNQRRKWRIQMRRLGYRIKKLKNEAHWKIARDLTKNNKNILISKFRVSGMIQKGKRKIHSETVRKMLHWSHFEFRQKLKTKAEELNSIVHEVSEHYTSKTCGGCGKINWKLGSKKWFHCNHCNFEIDRDFNGARNIFLMNFKEHLIPISC